MDFYDLLKKASLNQKKAEKELENNKRYNLKFAPMKKVERPKVNKKAIAERLKKKEEEEKKKAELEEKKKQAVLALRAEQEAAKSCKKRRDSSSTDLSSRKKEKVPEEKNKLDRRAKREDWYENLKLEESKAVSSEDEVETFAQKSKNSKREPEVIQKPKAVSFKELMALAASNTKGEKPREEAQARENEKFESNVKLKSQYSKGEVRDRREKHKVNKVVTKGTSKGGEVQRSVEKVKSLNKINNSASKPSSSGQGNKPTLFPNTKSHSNSTTSSRKGPSSHSKPPSKLDKNSKSLASDSKRAHSGFCNGEMKRQDGGDKKKIGGNQTSHHPPQRKRDRPDLVKEIPVVANQASRASQNSQHPPKRKGGWLDPVGKIPTVANQVEKASQKSQHPPKRKGGWLDPVEKPAVASSQIEKTSKINSKHVRESIDRKGGVPSGRNGPKVSKGGCLDPAQSTPSKNKVLHSQSKEKKSSLVPSSSASAKVKSPGQVKERKRGWLEPDEGQEPPVMEESGGWLGAMKSRHHHGPSPAKRKGGWLGPSNPEPSLVAKRGRLLSSEDEEEDSDLDGFIDDTPLEAGADVSSIIKQIFGYDKSKYAYESDYALRSMDASYSQILKEEARSTRLAIKEDAEELRKEKEREQKKLASKAKRK